MNWRYLLAKSVACVTHLLATKQQGTPQLLDVLWLGVTLTQPSLGLWLETSTYAIIEHNIPDSPLTTTKIKMKRRVYKKCIKITDSV